MDFKVLLSTMQEINAVNDIQAMEIAADLLLISQIPEEGEIRVETLIEQILSCSKNIRLTIPKFDFGFWAQGTVIEVVDFLICAGVVNGPLVDMAEESHVLLDASVSRTPSLRKYTKTLLKEIREYETFNYS